MSKYVKNFTRWKDFDGSYEEFQRARIDHYLSKTQQDAIMMGIKTFTDLERDFRVDDATFIAWGEVVPYVKDSEDTRRAACIDFLQITERDGGLIRMNPHLMAYRLKSND